MLSYLLLITATIFDSSLIHASGSLHSSLVVLPDSENSGTAFGISLLSRIQAEIYLCHTYFRFMAAIFDFPFIDKDPGRRSDRNLSSTVMLLDTENMSISVKISLLFRARCNTCAYLLRAGAVLDSDFRLHLIVLPIALLKRLTPKTFRYQQEFYS